jgi:hypothetical protein
MKADFQRGSLSCTDRSLRSRQSEANVFAAVQLGSLELAMEGQPVRVREPAVAPQYPARGDVSPVLPAHQRRSPALPVNQR